MQEIVEDRGEERRRRQVSEFRSGGEARQVNSSSMSQFDVEHYGKGRSSASTNQGVVHTSCAFPPQLLEKEPLTSVTISPPSPSDSLLAPLSFISYIFPPQESTHETRSKTTQRPPTHHLRLLDFCRPWFLRCQEVTKLLLCAH